MLLPLNGSPVDHSGIKFILNSPSSPSNWFIFKWLNILHWFAHATTPYLRTWSHSPLENQIYREAKRRNLKTLMNTIIINQFGRSSFGGFKPKVKSCVGEKWGMNGEKCKIITVCFSKPTPICFFEVLPLLLTARLTGWLVLVLCARAMNGKHSSLKRVLWHTICLYRFSFHYLHHAIDCNAIELQSSCRLF